MGEEEFSEFFHLLSQNNKTFDKLITNSINQSNGTSPWLESQRVTVELKIILLLAYGVLCVISVFGNTIVCYVILKNKRLHTATNFFIANLAVSDLLVTFINVPLNIARNLLNEWPFGVVPCHLFNYSLVLTSYVSTYTLTLIALDRHRVVLKPLSRRMSRRFAIYILVLIWAVAVCLSLPYGMYMKVKKVQYLVTKKFKRCRFLPPEPFSQFEHYMTVTTFVLQYCVPFSLIAVAYGRIVHSLWARTQVGAVTADQQLCQARAKRKSIKLLIAVVVVFAICWLPLNMYHLLTDLHPNAQVFRYNSFAFFACHWIAISSTCYNPFVYCWLNESFREEVKSRFCCFYRIPCRKIVSSDVETALLGGLQKNKGIKRVRSSSPSAATSSTRNVSSRRDPPSNHDDINRNNVNTNPSSGDLIPMETTMCDAEDIYSDEVTNDLILNITSNGIGTAEYHNGHAKT